jgi:hypothetical protein
LLISKHQLLRVDELVFHQTELSIPWKYWCWVGIRNGTKPQKPSLGFRKETAIEELAVIQTFQLV